MTIGVADCIRGRLRGLVSYVLVVFPVEVPLTLTLKLSDVDKGLDELLSPRLLLVVAGIATQATLTKAIRNVTCADSIVNVFAYLCGSEDTTQAFIARK